ncbi:hypothetical protein AAEX37_01014 [Oligella sp. MSHR50489EDL]|uniref:hypothetical protein n=1 Tax=Oligella sp. MSHR50489EDL TaxID=3139409 RepID=UPI003D81BFFB
MADFVLNPTWEKGVRQLETSDPVLAGPDGPDNIAPRQLANRTAFLKACVDHLFGATDNSNGSLNTEKLVLPVNRGGTGLTAISNGQLLRGNAQGGLSAISASDLIYQLSAITYHDSIPHSQGAPIIYLLGRGFLEWQTIGAWKGYASLMIGAFLFDTTIVARRFTIAAEGGNFSKNSYPALFAWAQENGHLVGNAQWKVGEYKFVDLGGDLFKAPDLRNQFIRGTGTDADNANARALGSYQQDAMQKITGRVGTVVKTGSSGVFKATLDTISVAYGGAQSHTLAKVDLDSSLTARTSTETRSCNTALAPRIIAF